MVARDVGSCACELLNSRAGESAVELLDDVHSKAATAAANSPRDI